MSYLLGPADPSVLGPDSSPGSSMWWVVWLGRGVDIVAGVCGRYSERLWWGHGKGVYGMGRCGRGLW